MGGLEGPPSPPPLGASRGTRDAPRSPGVQFSERQHSCTLARVERACDRRPVLGYTRRQLVIVISLAAGGAAGLAIDHWRHANPDVVAYLETLDRAPATVGEPVTRRLSARAQDAQDAPHASAPAPARGARGPASLARDGGRARPARADDATPLDVNLASAAQLERLPGVGPALAARIVDVRAREGPFGSVDDLRRVRGVGVATLERLRPRLVVTTP